LGRLLRPKADGRTAMFYTLISRDTVDQDFAQNRQRFLAEQGYAYEILDAEKLSEKFKKLSGFTQVTLRVSQHGKHQSAHR
jgi:superfamily II DNA or RNA helicase